ncbi:hypothetical protein APSETT445_007899 [Aspergillus pseudonomiae]
MLFFAAFAVFMTLLSTALSQPVDDISPRSIGAVKIVNSLSAPIYAWSVADKAGRMYTLPARGGSYEEIWRVNPKGGRISIKVSTKPDLKANDVIQFERLQEYEQLRQDMEKAWRTYLPTVDLQEALRTVRESRQVALVNTSQENKLSTEVEHHTEQLPTNFTEHSNAEDYEFDESQDFDNSIDGMGFLTADPHKAGYTGPQSGIAALKFLQSLPLYLPLNSVNTPSSLDEDDFPAVRSQSTATVSRYIDDYFALYHPAYPILHEGTFRARISGALAKPRDGSWPLLYNTVLAIGAFVGDSNATKCDIPFYKEARRHLTMDVLEKGSLSYVQAIVIMANYLQKRNKPNAGFILIGIGFSMALAIGLHREFGMPSTSPFTMEIRRRVWWTLFVFVSGAQLTLGRPAVSLVGVNIRLPSNLDDQDIAVDMEHLPECKPGPTITSALIAQVKLAKIANAVQVELLTHHVPRYEKAVKLEESIGNWWKDLPPYFNQDVNLEPHLELPKRVAFNYVSPSSRTAADSLVESLRNDGHEAFGIQADLADTQAPATLVSAVLSTFQTTQIDILVNNAGAGDNRPLEEVTLDSYNKLMDINVRAVVFMTQAVLPYIPRGGRIINLSSISARGGYPTQSVYAATKAAVEGLTRVWATELGHKYGVTVNAVNPGPVDTDMYQAAGPVHLARMEEQNKKVPAGQRCGTTQDIADIITFLAEERSRWVTGDVICANGGMLYT